MTEMTPKEQFRVGFLLKCAEDGRSMDDIRAMIKVAIPILSPLVSGLTAGLGMGAGNATASIPSTAGSAYAHYLAAPPALAAALLLGGVATGGAIGHGLGKLHSEDVDTDDLKQQELAQAYKVHAAKIRQLAALKKPEERVRSQRLLH